MSFYPKKSSYIVAGPMAQSVLNLLFWSTGPVCQSSFTVCRFVCIFVSVVCQFSFTVCQFVCIIVLPSANSWFQSANSVSRSANSSAYSFSRLLIHGSSLLIQFSGLPIRLIIRSSCIFLSFLHVSADSSSCLLIQFSGLLIRLHIRFPVC